MVFALGCPSSCPVGERAPPNKQENPMTIHALTFRPATPTGKCVDRTAMRGAAIRSAHLQVVKPHAAETEEAFRLNMREIEILTWAARGKTSAEIAVIVGVSKRTVDFHMDNARSKLGVATRIQAAVQAVIRGLIEI